MALSRLPVRYIGGLSTEDLKPRAADSLLSRNTSSSRAGDVTVSVLHSHSAEPSTETRDNCSRHFKSSEAVLEHG